MTLFEAIRATFRRDGYARSTELAYLRWIRAYLRFHGARHPRDMGAAEVSAFLAPFAPGRSPAVLKAIAEAACAAELTTRVTSETLRNSFARRLLEAGHPLGAVQIVLGHKDRRTTRRHASFAAGGAPVPLVSPLDLALRPPHEARIAEPA